MTEYYVGLMSGTSMDGIDAVVASFENKAVQLHATCSQAYPSDLRQALRTAIRLPLTAPLDVDGDLHHRVGQCFRDVALQVIHNSGIDRSSIRAIGSHGQTLRHQPDANPPFSLQVGDADLIAAATGVTTVANFRQADIEAGGQGAPLVPPFHRWLFHSSEQERVVVNIGGIANITVLPASNADVSGFDTGPGNGLMDVWTKQHLGTAFDVDGAWAAGGSLLDGLLEMMLCDPYFTLPPPKSTGFEYFNPNWLARFDLQHFATQDVQTTLCELSARSIVDAVQRHAPRAQQLFVCGGGIRNKTLMKRLRTLLGSRTVRSTAAAGLEPDWVEAAAFAWLAMRTMDGDSGNLPSVTGASHKVVLGDIHSP